MDGIVVPENQKWKRTKKTNSYRFISPFEDEIIHIIKTGHKNMYNDEEQMYFVVREDAHFIHNGECSFLSKEEIQNKFNIKVNF